jgi:cathepsin B
MRSVIAVSAFGVAAASSSGHVDRLAQIQEILDTPGVLWRPEVNDRFGPEAPGASKSVCGVKNNWKKELAAAIERGEVKRFVARSPGFGDVEIPETFDSEAKWPQCAKIIGDIRDQSNCGCCWAFGSAEAASDRMCIATNASLMIPLSAQDVCFCASDDGCDGGDINTPWSYIKDSGAVSGGQYKGTGPFGAGMCADFAFPHCHHHGPQGSDPYPAEGQPGCPSQTSSQCPKTCDASAVAPHKDFASDKYTFTGEIQSASGEHDIKKMIMAGGPVETAFTVYSDFENYAGGIYHHVTGEEAGGHAVKMVGWGVEHGVKYWKVANSWNPYWGEKGYFRIRVGEGGIDDMVTGSSHDAKWSKKFDPSPTPPAPQPPSPTPPSPGCADSEDFCTKPDIFDPSKECKYLAKDCKKTCNCCSESPPSYCSESLKDLIV